MHCRPDDTSSNLFPEVDQPRLDGPLDELVEALPPGVEAVEGPAGEVCHEDGVGGEVDEGVPRGRRVVHADGRLQARAPVDEDRAALVDAFDLESILDGYLCQRANIG